MSLRDAAVDGAIRYPGDSACFQEPCSTYDLRPVFEKAHEWASAVDYCYIGIIRYVKIYVRELSMP